MKVRKTIYNPNLLTPSGYKVVIGNTKKYFAYSDRKQIANYIKSIWAADIFGFCESAFIYADIDWDNDNILYCKYDYLGE